MDNPDQRQDVSVSEQTTRKNSIDREREYSSRQVKEIRHYEGKTNDQPSTQESKRARRKAKKDRKRHARLNRIDATMPVRHIPPLKNFHHQIPPGCPQPPLPERFERNQFSTFRQNTTRYDVRTRNDGYMSRRQNYTQPSRDSRRDDYDHYQSRNWNHRKRRPTSPHHRFNHYKRPRFTHRRHDDSNDLSHLIHRRYDDPKDLPPPIHLRYDDSNNLSPIHRRYDDSNDLWRYDDSNDLSPSIHRRYDSNFSPTPIRSSESPEPISSIKESIKHQRIINTQFASQSYLKTANVNSVYLEDPPPKLLVLDLNGTLVYRDNAKRNIILRPHMKKFMKYIFDSNSFFVMVWSSAQPINVDKMVKAAFGQYEKKLVAKWTRKHLNLSDQDYHQKVETIKDLEKVWEELNNRNSTDLPQIIWDQTNTILIDDSCLKAKLQPYNAIHLPDFDDERCKSKNDHELYNVIGYLRKLHNQSNVSAYIKDYPYTPNDNQNSSMSRDYPKNNNDLENEKKERTNNCVTS
ncbi:HAD-like domain-containing protein [Glomus cerebriforme]|uniref:Mitochondrial import inner membrane translocase subunit TIM50 n=1 Tax=Glomus cerebriforme TaxID=658196 RepID=A0A397SJP0_9GLOM|nr:HAD-like domain-containing protein [Glomus cerebriforme]